MRKHAGMFSYPSRVFMPREPAPAQQGTPLPFHCLDQIETVADLRQGSVFLVEVVLFENPVPADLAEFALVAHLDFAKPL